MKTLSQHHEVHEVVTRKCNDAARHVEGRHHGRRQQGLLELVVDDRAQELADGPEADDDEPDVGPEVLPVPTRVWIFPKLKFNNTESARELGHDATKQAHRETREDEVRPARDPGEVSGPSTNRFGPNSVRMTSNSKKKPLSWK